MHLPTCFKAALFCGLLALCGGRLVASGFDGDGDPISSWIPSEALGGEKLISQIGEDHAGRMYVVADGALLKGDGERWNRVALPVAHRIEKALFAPSGRSEISGLVL